MTRIVLKILLIEKMISIDSLYDQADSMSLTIKETNLPNNYCGFYDDQHKMIILDSKLNDRQQRCTLQHELIHACYHDTPGPALYMRRNEIRTRRETALKLIDPVEYKIAATVYENNKPQMAVALSITAKVLTDYENLLLEKRLQTSLPWFAEVL